MSAVTQSIAGRENQVCKKGDLIKYMIRNKKCKMLQRLIIILIISTMLLNVAGCGSYSTQDSNQTNNSDTLTEQTKDDEEIQFSDFLVERCVRKTLNKSWDDKITKSEVAEIKSLLIDPVYNPSIGINFKGSPLCYGFYEGYIDLVDLKYLTGLEILKIDNLFEYDRVVNVDSIANCKKLKKLYMQCNPGARSPNGDIGYGYRYWADIISELPDLEYIDLGMYVTSHMKDIMLSKTSNKDITIYNGYNNRYGKQSWSAYSANPMVLTDIEHYEGTMKYEYNGSDIELNEENISKLGKVPMLKINSYEELHRAVNSLSDTTEDLCIRLWEECTEFDCAMLAKFKNLCTLTITKAGSFFWRQSKVEPVGLKNIDMLAGIPHLQVINLGLCKGDISGLQNVKKLRELSLVGCEVTGYASLGKAEKLTELKVLWSGRDNFSSELSKEGSCLKNLKYYYCYCPEEVVEAQYMPNLQTLSAATYIDDLSVLKDYSELENLKIDYNGEYDLSKITSLNKLETICIRGRIVNATEILKLPNIVSVVLPDAKGKMNSEETDMLLREAASSDKLSMLQILEEWGMYYWAESYKESFRSLYDKGINDGFLQVIMQSVSEVTTEKTFEELWSQNFN